MGKAASRITEPVPPLRDGDRLTSKEFMRRYEATPEGFRAELLNGAVYVKRGYEMAPASSDGHSQEQIGVLGPFYLYSASTPGVEPDCPATLILPDGSTLEPDGFLYIDAASGGQSWVGTDHYRHGRPELVLEVANSSAAIDLGTKFDIYQANRIPEYLVWSTRTRRIDWFRLNRAGRYVAITASSDGLLRSIVFPGLWLDADALFANDKTRVIDVVRLGLASPEHAKFAAKLAKKRPR